MHSSKLISQSYSIWSDRLEMAKWSQYQTISNPICNSEQLLIDFVWPTIGSIFYANRILRSEKTTAKHITWIFCSHSRQHLRWSARPMAYILNNRECGEFWFAFMLFLCSPSVSIFQTPVHCRRPLFRLYLHQRLSRRASKENLFRQTNCIQSYVWSYEYNSDYKTPLIGTETMFCSVNILLTFDAKIDEIFFRSFKIQLKNSRNKLNFWLEFSISFWIKYLETKNENKLYVFVCIKYMFYWIKTNTNSHKSELNVFLWDIRRFALYEVRIRVIDS